MRNLVKGSTSFLVAAVLGFVGFLGSSLPASADVDYSTLTSAVDVNGVATALLAIAALMMVVVVARWGVRKILGFFR